MYITRDQGSIARWRSPHTASNRWFNSGLGSGINLVQVDFTRPAFLSRILSPVWTHVLVRSVTEAECPCTSSLAVYRIRESHSLLLQTWQGKNLWMALIQSYVDTRKHSYAMILKTGELHRTVVTSEHDEVRVKSNLPPGWDWGQSCKTFVERSVGMIRSCSPCIKSINTATEHILKWAGGRQMKSRMTYIIRGLSIFATDPMFWPARINMQPSRSTERWRIFSTAFVSNTGSYHLKLLDYYQITGTKFITMEYH
jgi:hypothetical protein